MRTERWGPIAGPKQYRQYDGYITNYHIGLCKNPDAMCDANAWRKPNNNWEGYGCYSV